MKTSELLSFIQDMAYEAGEVILKYQKKRHILEIENKGKGQGIVSEADKEAEKILMDSIQAKYPDHKILSEETPESKINQKNFHEAEYLWILDPLDGTNNFVNGTRSKPNAKILGSLGGKSV